MKKQVHILNGDALKDNFSSDITGEIIVIRECLVDGDVSGKNLDELFKNRAKFISECYQGFSKDGYYEKVIPEIQKLESLNNDVEINLWFEDDLFCQINFWFTLDCLRKFDKINSTFLVRPEQHNKYGFSGMMNPI